MSSKSSFWVHALESSGGLGSVDRINEVLFGLIMVLTFTCSISASTAGKEELSTLLWSALGCNVAWGFVDAFMFLFSTLLERGEMMTSVRQIRSATTETGTNQAVKEALPPFLAGILKPEHITHLSHEIKAMPDPPVRVTLTWKDFRYALIIFLLVFISTFPVTLPFIFIREVLVAMRLSNGIALVLLFFTGVYLAKRTGRKPFLTGLFFAVIGTVLVAATMALGG